MTPSTITISAGPRLKAAMILAVLADVLQLVVFPFFVEGFGSPADDVLDLVIGATMVGLLGWQWEFLPSFLGKFVPGVDLVPFWTLAVANVYRKSKRIAVAVEGTRQTD
ncbi:MAG: hypothetical protein WBE41_12675 [Terracidiphilus sp.]